MFKQTLPNQYRVLLRCLDVSLATQNVDSMRKQVLAEVIDALKADSACFFLVDGDRFIRPCDANMDSRLRQEYMDYFYRMGVFRPNQGRIKNSKHNVFQIEDLVDQQKWEATEFYRDYFRRLKIRYEMGIYLRYGGKIVGCILAKRGFPQRPFNRDDIMLAENLACRLVSPLQMHLLREQEKRELEILRVANDHHHCGLLILDQQFEVIYQNARMREFFARLDPETKKEGSTRGLLGKIEEAFSEGGANHAAELTVMVSDEETYSIRATALRLEKGGLKSPTYFVETQATSSALTLRLQTLHRRYGLTTREVEVVGLISQGLSHKEIANRLCISPWTVITHTRNIFEKMQVTNRTSAVQKALRS